MAQKRERSFNRILNPAGLAIISCALALLAAQPAFPAPTQSAKATPILKLPGQITPTQSATMKVPTTPQPTARAVRRSETFLASARQFHILATVEILHRLLAHELQAFDHPILTTFDIQPLALLIFESPISLPHHTEPVTSPPQSIERLFAISHCLLAPPVS